MIFSVTKNKQQLDPDLYTWDEQTRTFSTNEDDLVLDFSGIGVVTFKTGSSCIFKTGPNCIFNTGPNCIFKTGPDCTFDTGPDCTFDTGWNCTFKTGPNCIFKTGSSCTFNTGSSCAVIRRDIFEVIKLEKQENHIKLNSYNVPGYEEIKTEHTITIDGKEIKISDESYKELKKQLN